MTRVEIIGHGVIKLLEAFVSLKPSKGESVRLLKFMEIAQFMAETGIREVDMKIDQQIAEQWEDEDNEYT